MRGTIKPVGHSARGQASVVALGSGGRVLNQRSFRIAPGPRVRVYLVPRAARSDGQIPRDFVDLGALRGSRGNQRHTVPGSTDLRRYTSVVFCDRTSVRETTADERLETGTPASRLAPDQGPSVDDLLAP